MSSAVAGIYGALAALKIYLLHADSMIDKELAAYDAGFRIIENELKQAELWGYVQTAENEALEMYEKLVGLMPRRTLDNETRRALVLYRLGVAPFDFDREGMLSSILASGMRAEITENYAGESITVRGVEVLDCSLSLDSLKESVRTVLPCHLAAEFDFGNLTWEMFEDGVESWQEFNESGITWADFDINGDTILI